MRTADRFNSCRNRREEVLTGLALDAPDRVGERLESPAVDSYGDIDFDGGLR
jgi:hypothetical protein